VITPSVESNNLALKFLGSPTSSPLTTPTTRYRGVVGIWGIGAVTNSTDTEYLGEFLGSAMVEVGRQNVSGTAFLPSGGSTGPLAYFCRLIQPKIDRSLFPGFRVVGQEGEASPILILDSMGYNQFIIEMRCLAEGETAADDLGYLYREI
jgi:hypothetical protein